MPKGDRTGPDGAGPRSGRGLGYCNGYDAPGYTKGNPLGRSGSGRGFRRGCGRGFGRGYGYRWRIYQPSSEYHPGEQRPSVDPEEESTYLKQTIEDLEQELRFFQDRLQQLEKKKEDAP